MRPSFGHASATLTELIITWEASWQIAARIQDPRSRSEQHPRLQTDQSLLRDRRKRTVAPPVLARASSIGKRTGLCMLPSAFAVMVRRSIGSALKAVCAKVRSFKRATDAAKAKSNLRKSEVSRSR